MHLKSFLLFSFLVICNLSLANNNLPNCEINHEPEFVHGSCELPPPTDFFVKEVGSTWVKFGWTPDSEVHRIRIYRVADSLLLQTVTFGAGVSEGLISNLPPGVPCYPEIRSVCGNGVEGKPKVLPPTGLILDLLITGFTSGDNSPSCYVTNQGQCEFSKNPTTISSFRITNGAYSLKFGVNRGTEIPTHFHVYLENPNSSAPGFMLRCQGGIDPIPGPTGCSSDHHLEIWFQDPRGLSPTLIGTFNFIDDQSLCHFTVLSLDNGFVIQRLSLFNPQRPGGENITMRDTPPSLPSPDGSLALASPNPFSESLDVTLTQTASTPVLLKMYNLSGQEVLHQEFAAGQDQYNLSTANLAKGFYLLRVEADGAVQTLKVVKSE